MTKEILGDIQNEILRQNFTWGEMRHSGYKWNCILTEEAGEFSKAVNDQNMDKARHEAVQVAAVAVQIIHAIDEERTKS